jgi:hypothetical protein
MTLKQDIAKVVDYLYHDEQRHYLENRGKDHIYLAIRRLKKYIERR